MLRAISIPPWKICIAGTKRLRRTGNCYRRSRGSRCLPNTLRAGTKDSTTGVVISRLKFGRLLYYHGGGVEGFSSSIQRYPKDRVCIVVLSNFDSYKPWELGDHIAFDLFNQSLSAIR
jgi:hypothetical protein